MEAGSADCALELVAGIGAGELVALLLQLHREIGRRAEDLGGHDPLAGKGGLRLLRECGKSERGEHKRVAEGGVNAHRESPWSGSARICFFDCSYVRRLAKFRFLTKGF